MIDWGVIWSIFHQQCMLLWQFLIVTVYWGCPFYWACPYNATSLGNIKEYFSMFRHTIPFFSILLDFAFNAMRFNGWSTWLNLAVSLWFEIFYILLNYSYAMHQKTTIYIIWPWKTDKLTATLVSLLFCGLNVLVWWIFVGISSIKNWYYKGYEVAKVIRAQIGPFEKNLDDLEDR